jgi:hypothetical protein
MAINGPSEKSHKFIRAHACACVLLEAPVPRSVASAHPRSRCHVRRVFGLDFIGFKIGYCIYLSTVRSQPVSRIVDRHALAD